MVNNLVIGSEGFVGKSLCKFLEQKSEKVMHFDIKRTPDEDARSANLQLDKFDRVYFLAWDVGGAKYLYRDNTQLLQLDWNLRLMLNVLEQLRQTPKPFIFISSQLAEQYDTVYGVTKRLGEIWTHLLGGVRVRLWNVYGPIESINERSHVVSDFMVQAIKTGKIKMMTTGKERRQFIYIDDVCAALHYGITAGFQGVYDITSFEWIQVMDVAKLISEITGAEVIPGDMVGSTPITPIMGKMPGWLPKVSLEEGLKRMASKFEDEQDR